MPDAELRIDLIDIKLEMKKAAAAAATTTVKVEQRYNNRKLKADDSPDGEREIDEEEIEQQNVGQI